MATDRIDDLRAFCDFAEARLAAGGPPPSLDETLRLWEHENAPPSERQAALDAIRRGLADVEAGRVRPAREAIAELRRKHGLPSGRA
jgi:hypothetical protein